METEKIKFKLELYSEYFDKPPYVEIYVKDKWCHSGIVVGTKDSPNTIEFFQNLTHGENYDLKILRTGKDIEQCQVDSSGNVLKDQLLHIKMIEIDEIDLGSVVYSGVYTPEYQEPWYSQQVKAGKTPQQSFKNVTCMGHNGEWKWTFSSPFYMWLLENLY